MILKLQKEGMRRQGVRLPIKHSNFKFFVTFNCNDAGRWFECFYAHTGDGDEPKYGSTMSALLSDNCINISKRLEHGESFSEIASSLGEDRAENAVSGEPSSIAGAIARAGAELERKTKELGL
jgi:hypothetical protein